MTTGERIREVRRERGLSMEELGKRLGITAAAVSRYELGQRKISFNTLRKIAKTLNISIDDLVPDAGIGKSDAYDILYSKNTTLEEKCDAALVLFMIWFSRSVSAHGHSSRHPKFDDYVAMLLNQRRFQEEFGDEVYSSLVKKYGKKPGIPEGQTTYLIDEINKYGENLTNPDFPFDMPYKPTKLIFDINQISSAISKAFDAKKDFDNLYTGDEPEYQTLLKLNDAIWQLNDLGQQEAIKRVEELAEIPKYQRKDEDKEGNSSEV